MNKGQSLFELIVAIGVSGLVLISLVSLTVKSISNATYSKNKTLTTHYTQEAVEWLRAQRDLNWDTFTSYAASGGGKIYCLNNLSFSNGGACGPSETIPNTTFTRQVLLTYNATPESVQAVVTTTWLGVSDRQHESRTSTVFTNWMVD
jgi:Tfp pilus assembly protein PilV